jgi:hypothetical protein
MMGFKYLVEKHVGNNMMVQMLQDGILKLNHLLFNELFKRRKIYMNGG